MSVPTTTERTGASAQVPGPSGPSSSRSRKARRENDLQVSRSSAWLTMGVLSLAAVYFLVPVWWLVVSATKDNTALFNSNGFWFSGQSLVANVQEVLTRQDGLFVRWLFNSLLYAGLGGALATLIGVACGFALAKYEFRGRGLVFGGILAGILIPSALLTVPLYLMFAKIGLVNSIWSVLIPSMVNPFAVYLGRVYAAAAVPDELMEAARIDGAGEIRIFVSIALRLMSPALVTVFLFTFVSIWNNFFLPLIMLSDQGLYPVTLGIYNWYTQTREATYAIVITGSLLSVLPLVAAFLSLQRFWRAGLTSGSVKA